MTDLLRLADECESELSSVFAAIDKIAYENTRKVLMAFSKFGLSERHFNATTGYGYNDDGRDIADKIFANVHGCEDGFVRHNIISGTHAIAISLFGLLKHGDTLLAVSGKPYDTLLGVISGKGSLAENGVNYKEIELIGGRDFDAEKIINELRQDKTIKVVHIQRSRGYSTRKTLTSSAITTLYRKIKRVSDAFVFVDNCYGEFTSILEPECDIMAGSLIKNPGGGMAETGGYITGTKKAVAIVENRLSFPGVGREAGASLGQNKSILKGIFYSPHTVANAKKTSHFAALLFKKLGYEVDPDPFELREDIVQVINFRSESKLLCFCRGIQAGSPVDSGADPIPGYMPGYSDPIIMACGAFTQGSSIELSADAPLREPFCVYLQGGLTYESGKYGVLSAAQRVGENKN